MNGLEKYKKDLASKARIIEVFMEDIPDLKGRLNEQKRSELNLKTSASDERLETQWEVVSNKNNRIRTEMKNQKTSADAIPIICNRFKILEDDVGLPDIVEKERYNTRQQSRLKKVIKYRLSINKVIVVGDGHARGCAEDLTPLLRQNFQVTENVKPRKIVRSPNEESSNATKKDYIVLWTGSTNNTNEWLKGIEEYVK
jgi:hypothetical protein